MGSRFFQDRSVILASPCNFEALDADLEFDDELKYQPTPSTPTEEKNEKKAPLKNQRFKRLVRTLITNTVWAKEAANKRDQNTEVPRSNAEKLNFNVNAFRAHIQSCGKLSPQAIEILSKPACVRHEHEIKMVQKIVYRLNCFDRYPIFVKQELARVIYYDKFDDGRIIIKQGHSGISFYFIVSGSVVVERIEYDPFNKEYYSQRVGELHAGDSFGELALLHNSKRTATIRCNGSSEFLRVDKPDFDEVLRSSHQREWEIRTNMLRTHPVFEGWTTAELKMANGHSKMKTYPPNTVIVSENLQKNDRVFLIASGHCTVVLRVDILKKFISKTKYKYSLPPLKITSKFIHRTTSQIGRQSGHQATSNNGQQGHQYKDNISLRKSNLDLQRTSKIGIAINPEDTKLKRNCHETRFFSILNLSSGDYFNVGEDLQGMYVVTVGRVEVVQINKHAFTRHGGARVLEDMKEAYLSKLPTSEQAFERYSLTKRWNYFKKNLVKNVVKNSRRQHNVNHDDIPGATNFDQLYYFHTSDLV